MNTMESDAFTAVALARLHQVIDDSERAGVRPPWEDVEFTGREMSLSLPEFSELAIEPAMKISAKRIRRAARKKAHSKR